MWFSKKRCVIGREDNVVRVDFTRKPDPPAPLFPGASGLRPIIELSQHEGGSPSWVAPTKMAAS
jgi:hypothetical protein